MRKELARAMGGTELYRRISARYYRHLYGLSFPLAGVVERAVRQLEIEAGFKDVPTEAGRWDEEYAAGAWSYMRGREQRARYSIVAGQIHARGPQVSVLDVGCGEGLLEHNLVAYGRYLGVDLSGEAIRRARAEARTGARFAVGDASSFEPEGHFEVVVFNEVLYYLPDPLHALRHYRRCVREGGDFVVSLYDYSPRAAAISRLLASSYRVRDKVTTRTERSSWTCLVLDPAGS